MVTSSVTVTLDGETTVVENGEYLFTGLSIGMKELTAQAEGYETYTDNVVIELGQNTHDIYMKPILPGPVAHYTFNGDAQDSSGNGNHGTVYGATLVPDRFGVEGRAYSFDRVDDYIEVERQSFIKPERKELSVAAWFKLTANSGATRIVVANDFVIYQFQEELGFTISVPRTQTVRKKVSYNEWLHFVGIYDGTYIKVYINGADNPEIYEHPGTISDPGQNLNFGRDLLDPSNPKYWRGIIDDFRIYDRVLTEEEINELASDGPIVISQ